MESADPERAHKLADEVIKHLLHPYDAQHEGVLCIRD